MKLNIARLKIGGRSVQRKRRAMPDSENQILEYASRMNSL